MQLTESKAQAKPCSQKVQGHESSPGFKLCAVAYVLEVYLLIEEQLDNHWAATIVTLLAGLGILAHIWRLFKYCRPGRSA